MPNLYLIRRSDEAVWVYSRCGPGKWQLSRMATSQSSKVKLVLLRGPKGWMVQDQSPGKMGGSSCYAVPVGGAGTNPQSGTLADGSPPLGLWQSPDGKCEYTLSDSYPRHSPLQSPIVLQEPFVTVTITETASKSRLDVKFANQSITDDGLDRLFSKLGDVLVNLARRPDTTMVITCDLREASVPGMRHVRKFMAFAKDKGDIMDLFIRGNAMILKPTGFVGNAIVNVVKMLQRVLQAAWPETIVPGEEEATRFLETLPVKPLATEEGTPPASDMKDTSPAMSVVMDTKPVVSNVVVGEVTNPPTVKKDVITLPEQVAPQLLPFSSPTHGVADVANDAELPWQPLKTDTLVKNNNVSKNNNTSSPNRRYVTRKRNNAVTHPDLMKLEVPVWVAMGYKSNRSPQGCVDSRVQDVESIMEGERDPVLCGCSCKSKEDYALQPQLQALFALAG